MWRGHSCLPCRDWTHLDTCSRFPPSVVARRRHGRRRLEFPSMNFAARTKSSRFSAPAGARAAATFGGGSAELWNGRFRLSNAHLEDWFCPVSTPLVHHAEFGMEEKRQTAPKDALGYIIDVGQGAKTEILAHRLPRRSGRTERDSEHDERTVFGCAPAACASGYNGAHDDLDFFLSWRAARVRGLAR